MPRLKCHFCEALIVVRPSNLKIEGFLPKCYKCSAAHPPPEWQCEGISKSSRGNRMKGDRCARWRVVGHKFCIAHKPKEEE